MTPADRVHAHLRFRPGLYKHVKTGNLYRALFLAAHHDSREPWVVYVSLSRGSLNVRPLKGLEEVRDGWDDAVGTVASPDGVTHTTVPRFQLFEDSIDGVESTPENRMLRTLLTLVRDVPNVAELLVHLDKDGGTIPHADFGPAAGTVEARAKLLLDTVTGKIPSTPLDTSDL